MADKSSPHRLRLLPSRGRRGGLKRVRNVPMLTAVADDGIVRDELSAGRIGLEALRTAWQHKCASGDARALWRILADVQGTDAASLFKAAAQAEGYTEAVASIKRTSAFLSSSSTLAESLGLQPMIEVGMFPAIEDGGKSTTAKCCLVSFEPQSPEVQSIASTTTVQLQYVDPITLAQLVDASVGSATLNATWWYRQYVLGVRPIRLYTSSEFTNRRRAA